MRRMRRLASIAVLGGLVCACREPEVSTLSSKLSLRYLPGCAPAKVERIAIEPLGDFALGEQSLTAVNLASTSPVLLAGLPADTHWYRLGVTTESYRGVALARAGAEGERYEALLLPLEQSCRLLNEPLPSRPQGALVLVDGQDLLLAGGADDAGEGVQEATVLRVARPALAPDAQGLLVPRAGAAAVAADGESWLIGGATSLREGTAALDTFERYSAELGAFTNLGRLRARRVDASATRLLDGSVLVVGGRNSVGGSALTSLETVAADGERSELWSEALPFPVAQAALRLRDDGSVLLIARVDDGLRFALLEPRSRGVVELAAPAGQSLLDAQLSVALPGARVVMVEVDAEGATTGRLKLMLEDASILQLDDWLGTFAGIARARTLSLGDGRILLTGVRQGQPAARVIDPGSREVSTRALDLEVSALFKRDDGSMLLVGPGGARVLREDARTPFDNPGGTLLAEDSGALCLDAYGRFVREGLALRASVPGARFDLAQLRYRDVTLTLRVEGAAELLLRRADGQERSLQVGTSQIGPAFCTLEVPVAETIELTRSEQRVTLRVGTKSKSCVLDGFQGPLAVALRALEAGVVVSELRIARR